MSLLVCQREREGLHDEMTDISSNSQYQLPVEEINFIVQINFDCCMKNKRGLKSASSCCPHPVFAGLAYAFLGCNAIHIDE